MAIKETSPRKSSIWRSKKRTGEGGLGGEHDVRPTRTRSAEESIRSIGSFEQNESPPRSSGPSNLRLFLIMGVCFAMGFSVAMSMKSTQSMSDVYASISDISTSYVSELSLDGMIAGKQRGAHARNNEKGQQREHSSDISTSTTKTGMAKGDSGLQERLGTTKSNSGQLVNITGANAHVVAEIDLTNAGILLSNQQVITHRAERLDILTKKSFLKPSNIGKTKDVQDMNIVLFYGDDWTWKTIGAVNNIVSTPNIDEISRNGVMFTHNCVTSSICWQSRASFITGRYVSVHKALKLSDDALLNKTINWKETLFPLLRQHGYHVGYVGKYHGPLGPDFRAEAFDFDRIYYGSHYLDRNGKRRHITELNGEDAIEYLQKKLPKDQTKFALAVAFFAIHSWDGKHFPNQYQPQNRTKWMYINQTIPEPKTATKEHHKRLPNFLQGKSESYNRWKERYNTPERYQETMKRIYRMAKETDDVVGDVISELKAQDRYNNTMFIFTTDNGIFHGEHQLAGKWYPHEESVRVPLAIQDPRMSDGVRGTINDDLTLNIDLAPTILSAAGIPVPQEMQGQDISQLYLQRENQQEKQGKVERALEGNLPKPWRTDFFYEWNTGEPKDAIGHNFNDWIPPVFALIQKDYKYFYWPRAKYEQIFHVEEDPFEENDIFDSVLTTNDSVLKELRERYAYLKDLSQSGARV